MKVFILYNNPRHNFRTIMDLFPDAELVYIFHPSDLRDLTIEKTKARMIDILDSAAEEDHIVMNGPSFMTACAGFVWMTQEKREAYNMIAYDPTTKEFTLKKEE